MMHRVSNDYPILTDFSSELGNTKLQLLRAARRAVRALREKNELYIFMHGHEN